MEKILVNENTVLASIHYFSLLPLSICSFLSVLAPSKFSKDVVSDGALLTVRINTQSDSFSSDDLSLCFEILGQNDKYFNLISDSCLSVNAHYSQSDQTPQINIIDEIAILLTNYIGEKVNISVNKQCNVQIGDRSIEQNVNHNGVVVYHQSSSFVSIFSGNQYCGKEGVLMTINCESDDNQGLQFNVFHGRNGTAHGLLGEDIT